MDIVELIGSLASPPALRWTPGRPRWDALRRVLLCASLCSVGVSARADPSADQLKRCLADFGGIHWQLPYLPSMHITACSAPATGDTQPGGRRSLELLEDLVLPPVPQPPPPDLDYVAVQDAAYQHFDALFRHHGFTRVSFDYGDARTHHYLRSEGTQRRGGVSVTVDPEQARAQAEWIDQENSRMAALPPIPFVRIARYTRSDSTGPVTLVIESTARNAWRITVDGLPAGSVKEPR